MAYTTVNFPTKKALKEAVLVGDRPVRVQDPFIGQPVENGTVFLEGPWSPRPHTWYAKVTVKDGVIVKVT